MKGYTAIENYGIIGNLETCALVSNAGSIDWCCFPHIESPSLFANILDANKGGYFVIQPQSSFSSKQKYLENTNILPTEFTAETGEAVVIDFMPIKNSNDDAIIHQAIYRRLECISGKLTIKLEFMPRFDYARSETTVTLKNQVIEAIGSKPNEQAYLYLPKTDKIAINHNTVTVSYELKKDDKLWFILRYGNEKEETIKQYEETLNSVYDFWKNWAHNCGGSAEGSPNCVFHGPWHNLVIRSGLVLKLLMHKQTGAIAAAMTASIPEVIGGIRNWDYRYNWIRDASFTIQALYNLGHVEEAKKHLKWFISVCKQSHDPSEIQIMYGMHGEKDLTEVELDHLEGYKKSRPVRIGNAAAQQKQFDVYGELINAFYETSRYEKSLSTDDWKYIRGIVDYVCSIWQSKDSGIWEVRGGLRHFIHSKVMCWVAVNRGIKIAQQNGFNAPFKRWRETEDNIHAFIVEKGFNKSLNSFVQSVGSEDVDASSLLIPIVGFLPFNDPRIQGTIDMVLKRLVIKDELVYRYFADDGLPGKEGAFALCTFWLINALALSGRIQEAEKIFTTFLKHVTPTGLLSEEIDPHTGNQLGNFPQAFSHIGLINSALYIGKAKGKNQKGPTPMGSSE